VDAILGNGLASESLLLVVSDNGSELTSNAILILG
jgi:hypothetical protein